MQLFFIFSLFVFGLLFGSFSSVVIERLHTRHKSIATGRSECPHCKHELGALDLVPLFSYLFLLGKCRYCKKKISPIYPLLELSMATLFALGGTFFTDFSLIFAGSGAEIARLIFILTVIFVVVVFTFYDLRFMEIPDEVMIPSIFVLAALLAVSSWITPLPIFSHFLSFDSSFLTTAFWNGLIAALIVYCFFYLQILIPGLSYAFREKKYKLALEIITGSVTFFGWMAKQLFTWKQDEENPEEEEIPTWIGGGDLRIALFMGLVAGIKITLLALFLSYIIGSIVGIAVLAITRERGKQVPFGPFLGAGLLIALLAHSQIFALVEHYFLVRI